MNLASVWKLYMDFFWSQEMHLRQTCRKGACVHVPLVLSPHPLSVFVEVLQLILNKSYIYIYGHIYIYGLKIKTIKKFAVRCLTYISVLFSFLLPFQQVNFLLNFLCIFPMILYANMS